MRKTLIALVLALAMPSSSMAAIAQNQMATEWSDKPHGAVYNAPGGGKIYIASMPGMNKIMKNVENSIDRSRVAQTFGYAQGPGVQYQPPSFFQGAGAPIVVPPTVITTPGSMPRECRRKRITFALFFEIDASDC
jgi:hypothetical protein